jgi:hypothetical protein
MARSGRDAFGADQRYLITPLPGPTSTGAAISTGPGCGPSAMPSGVTTPIRAAAGADVYWRGDFDWTGLRAVSDAVGRYDAHPWRMKLTDYETALATGPTERLRGTAADSLWDPALAHLMARTGWAVMEERLIPLLLADLTAG